MINNVVLIGRLTRDVELRYTPSNIAVATFNLAVNRNFKNQDGEREADFINCVMWQKSAENLANWTRKGMLIGITGILDIVTNVRRCLMTNYKKQTYIIIQEAMVERIRFLEDELYNRAYKDIERQEAEIDRLKEKCVNLMLENADYVWDEMARSAMAKRANTRRWRSRGCI